MKKVNSDCKKEDIANELKERVQELTFQNKEKVDRVAELILANAYLENLINYANAPIIVLDPQLHITRFNHYNIPLGYLVIFDLPPFRENHSDQKDIPMG